MAIVLPPNVGIPMNVASQELDEASEDLDFDTATMRDNLLPARRTSAKTRVCTECGTTNSPLWRLGPAGPKTMCNACGIKWKRKNNIGKKRRPRPEELPTINLPPRKKPKINYSRLLNSTGLVDTNARPLDGELHASSNSSIEDFDGSDLDEEQADALWPERGRPAERERRPVRRSVGKRRRRSTHANDSGSDAEGAAALAAFSSSADELPLSQDAEPHAPTGGLIDARFLRVASLELEHLQAQQVAADEIAGLRADAARLRAALERKDRAIAAALAHMVSSAASSPLRALLPADIIAELTKAEEYEEIAAEPANAGEPQERSAGASPTPSPGEQPSLASPAPLLMS